jgi:hypothetical protein
VVASLTSPVSASTYITSALSRSPPQWQTVERIEAQNKVVQYLFHLEMPFFLGVVNVAASELKIYSAERFPRMTAVFGIPEKLWLRPADDGDLQPAWAGTDANRLLHVLCRLLHKNGTRRKCLSV